MPTLLFTGGGTAGHVVPQIALINHVQSLQPKIALCYVGSRSGIEKQLISAINIPYYGIVVGKWRRYFSWRNLFVPFQMMLGVTQSLSICYRLKPDVVFSKGGFVALPVVFAAWLLRIPIIVHESDVMPGLANRLSFPLARLICYSFDVTPKTYYRNKTVLTGLPIREELSQGDPQEGLELLGFHSKKPVLLVWGGSLGASTINHSIWRLLTRLTQQFQVAHVCGPHKLPVDVEGSAEYRIFEYLETVALSHVLACADLVISRAGATAIYELLMLRKPNVLCPLSTKASRGEQIHNARYLENLGLSMILYPDSFSDDNLVEAVNNCYREAVQWKQKMTKFNLQSGTQAVYEQLLGFL